MQKGGGVMASIAPLERTLLGVVNTIARSAYVTEKEVKEVPFYERIFRALFAWTGLIDSTIQSCARSSLDLIAKEWARAKRASEDKGLLLFKTPFVRSLFEEDLGSPLKTLYKESMKAHAVVVKSLSDSFGVHRETLRLSFEDQLALATYYVHHKDNDRALKLLEPEWMQQDPQALFLLFHLTENREFLERAASMRFPKAQIALATLHLKGRCGLEPNRLYAKQLLKVASEENDKEAKELLQKLEEEEKGLLFRFFSFFSPKKTEPQKPFPSSEIEIDSVAACPEEPHEIEPKRPLDAQGQDEADADEETAEPLPFDEENKTLALFHPSSQILTLRELERDAAAGKGEAHLELAIRYQKGEETQRDPDRARSHLQRAASEGNEEALGVLCFQRRPNLQEDSFNASDAIDALDPPSEEEKTQTLVVTGHDFLKSGSLLYDPEAAMKCFQRARQRGSIEAVHSMGLYYDRIALKPNQAFKQYQEAADKGCLPEAQFELSQCLFYGLGCKKEIKKALKYLQLSSDQNFPPAIENLSRFYKEGIGGVDQDVKKAEELLLKLQEMEEIVPGDVLVQLGDLYHKGSLLVGQNLSEAFRLFEKGREKGSVLAYLRIADSLKESNPKKAFSFIKEAHQLELLQKGKRHLLFSEGIAAYSLGLCFETGELCAKDPQLALHYFHEGALEGCEAAWEKLAKIYEHGALSTSFSLSLKKREGLSKKMRSFIEKFRVNRQFNRKELQKVFKNPLSGD